MKEPEINLENFTNTPDVEFNYALGDVLVSALYVRYPIEIEYSSEKQNHFHDYFELIYIEKGECAFSTNDRVYSLKSGDFVMESPLCEHKYDGVEKCIAYKFGFSFSKTFCTLSAKFLRSHLSVSPFPGMGNLK